MAQMSATLTGTVGGVASYSVTTPYITETTTMRIIAPTAPAAVPHRLAIVLPVTPGLDTSFGDGLTALQSLGYHNSANLHLVGPSFPTQPWMGDNPGNTGRRYESSILDLKVWCTEHLPAFSTCWGISFSKGGVSIIHLMLRNPTLFDLAVAWDPPTNQGFVGEISSTDMDQAYGTQANWETNYRPNTIAATASVTPFTSTPRLWISGDVTYAAPPSTQRIWHTSQLMLFAQTWRSRGALIGWNTNHVRHHLWTSGWLSDALTWLQDPVAFTGPLTIEPRPTLSRCLRLRFPDLGDGTVVNTGTSSNATSAPVQSGMTFQTDGTVGPYLHVLGSANALNFGTAFTDLDRLDKSFFFRLRLSSLPDHQTFLAKESATVNGWAVMLDPTGKLHWHAAAGYDNFDSGTLLGVGAWLTCALTWDAALATVRYYVNGTPASQQLLSPGPPEELTTTEALYLGRLRGTIYPFNGDWADVQAFVGMLTPAQVTQLHASGELEPVPPPQAVGNPVGLVGAL